MPKVSIIIPVYNAEKYLSRALDSVTSQSFLDVEVICVNDGSTDTSLLILQEYQRRDKRINIITQDNSGGSAARNAGLARATGEYVMFLDSDDVYAKNVVTAAYNRAVKTGVDVVLYNFARFVGKPTAMAVKSKITPGHDIEYFTKDSYSDRFFNDFATITWNKLVKKSVITDNDLTFDTGLSHNHDVDFSIRLMLAAESYSWLNDIGYYYRANESGLTATKRSDPTNVLKILLNLNKKIKPKYSTVKQSFDNYVADMIVGTLEKYSNSSSKQREVFDFAHNVVIPTIGFNKKENEYIYSTLSREILHFVILGNYAGFTTYTTTAKRKIRVQLRRFYDTAQRILSFFIV